METESSNNYDIAISGSKKRTRPKEKCHICEQKGFLYNFYGAFCCEGETLKIILQFYYKVIYYLINSFIKNPFRL
jgi:hypothetical protein